MLNQLVYINDDMIELEEIYVSYIEEEIDLFFRLCSNSANVFALMVAKDLKSYSKEVFETMVISPEAIDTLINNINRRICEETNMDEASIEKIGIYFDEFNQYDRILARRINDYKVTHQITKISEDVISNAISFTLGNACSSNIVDYVFSKAKLGEKILGKNNNDGQIERHHKEIFSHIEGILINIKTKLKNEMMRKWLQYVNDDQQKFGLVSIVPSLN